MLVTAIGLSAVVCLVIGLRGWKLLGGTLVVLVPVDFAWLYLVESLIQPPLEDFPANQKGR